MLRTLLALLAVSVGRVVDTEVLIDELWGEELPKDPRAALAVQATRLRTWLTPDDPRRGPVSGERGGYRLTVDPLDVDVQRFDDAASKAMSGPAPLAPDLLGIGPEAIPGDVRLARAEEALGEWRDIPFGGCVLSDRLRAEQVRLVERRLLLVERRAELLIAGGEADRALEGLLPVRATTLSRERLTALTMLALHHLDRRKDALTAYREYYEYLRDEFALSPGLVVDRLHRRVLSDEPADVVRVVTPALPAPATPPTALVGREAALAVLDEARTTGGILVIKGAAGMGKSTLLGAAVRDARAAGARATIGAWDDDGAPLSAWHEAMTGLGGVGAGPVTSATVHATLSRLARETTVLVGLDDAQRADGASFGVLRGLARRGLPGGVLVVLAVRAPDGPVAPRSWEEVVADLDGAGLVRHLVLEELDHAAVVELSRARLGRFGPTVAAEVGALVARRSGGHPLHVVALLRALAQQPDEETCRRRVAEVPDTLRPLFQRHVAGLPEPAQRVLGSLATLRPVALEILAAVVAVSAVTLLEIVEPAIASGLVVGHPDADEIDFRHDLMAEAVRDDVPAVQRRRWHCSAFETLGPDADPFERRRHALGAGPLVARSALADVQRLAARAAYRRGAPVEALAMFDAAIADISVEHRADVLLGRGLALTALGRLDEAHDVLDELIATGRPEPAQSFRAAVGDGTIGTQFTGDARRLARLRLVTGQTESRTLPDRDRLELLLALSIEETVLEGRVTTVGAMSELIELATRLVDHSDPHVAVRARLVLFRRDADAPVPVARRLADAREAARIAEDCEGVTRLDAVEALVSALVSCGRIAEIRDRVWWLRQEARRVRRPRSVWVSALVDAALALAAGEIDEADALAVRAQGIGAEAGILDAAGTFQGYLMVRHWQTGTAALLGEVPAQAARAYPHVPAWTAAAACADVQAGRLDCAAEHLRRYRERRAALEARTFDRPGLAMAATAAFRLRDVETARLVVDALPVDPDAVIVLGLGGAVLGPAMFSRGLAHATLGNVDVARDHLAQAAVLAGDAGWTPWQEYADAVARHLSDGAPSPLPLGLSS